MDTKTVKLFAEYNQKTNQAMNRLIEGLTPEQWDHAFAGYYPTIHALCNHLYVSDFAWLKRFGNHRAFHYLEDALFQAQLTLSSDALADQRDYLEKRAVLDAKLTALASEVTDADLAATLTYANFKGVEQRRNLGGLLLHLFNHGTHHRGMISLYLESLGIENDYSSLFHLV
jgi:uncharacterized damage-inducible protein DinB